MFSWFYRQQIEMQRQEAEMRRIQLEYELIIGQHDAQEIAMLERWALLPPGQAGA